MSTNSVTALALRNHLSTVLPTATRIGVVVNVPVTVHWLLHADLAFSGWTTEVTGTGDEGWMRVTDAEGSWFLARFGPLMRALSVSADFPVVFSPIYAADEKVEVETILASLTKAASFAQQEYREMTMAEINSLSLN